MLSRLINGESPPLLPLRFLLLLRLSLFCLTVFSLARAQLTPQVTRYARPSTPTTEREGENWSRDPDPSYIALHVRTYSCLLFYQIEKAERENSVVLVWCTTSPTSSRRREREAEREKTGRLFCSSLFRSLPGRLLHQSCPLLKTSFFFFPTTTR